MIHMSPIFAFLFALAVLCAILANTLMLVVIGTVNRQLPDNEQIPYFWWSMKKVRQQYRKFNPGGRLLVLVPTFGIRMIVFFLASTFFRRCDGSCSSSAARKEARPAEAAVLLVGSMRRLKPRPTEIQQFLHTLQTHKPGKDSAVRHARGAVGAHY